MTDIEHQKKLDANTMNMFTKSEPMERNRRKPSSERNNEYLREYNMIKTISNTQYVPDDIDINTTTSNIHNIIPSSTASNTISNNVSLKKVLPVNNNNVIQTTPSTIRVPASFTAKISSVTGQLHNSFQQTRPSQTNSYTLSQSTDSTSLKKKIKEPLIKYSTICTTKISAQSKNESRTNLLSHPI